MATPRNSGYQLARRLLRAAFLGAATLGGASAAVGVISVGGASEGACRAAEDNTPAEKGPRVRYIDPDPASGTSAAVVVPPTAALAHTALILPVDSADKIVAAGDAAAQAERVLENLERALAAAGSSREQMVRLNVYAADYPSLQAAREQVAKAFTGEARPAATWIVTAQPREEVLVTMDGVAVAPLPKPEQIATFKAEGLPSSHSLSHVSVMPPGEIYYISGQLEKGQSLAEGVRNTMAGLYRTLEHFGLDPNEHVVQVKAFINPMDEADEALEAIADSYQGEAAPPVVLTEWQASIPGPTEIEMIAAKPAAASNATDAPEPQAHEAARFLTPPWMSASPVYSRAAVVRSAAHEGWVFVSGITGDPAVPREKQVEQVFAVLKQLCERTGCDFNHLIKATYYACDPSVSPALREVRPNYYNAERPPAASLIHVRGVGTDEGIYTLDMIGVSVRPAEKP